MKGTPVSSWLAPRGGRPHPGQHERVRAYLAGGRRGGAKFVDAVARELRRRHALNWAATARV